ncbi:hypothetical protein ACGFSB_21450 [Streptomyces sp. NPDC048441]|uniref:hypothetical protein n=1 Tax=Streptomyces sp. NPDC048441 TaxID=3365552 RepID=UPI0037124D25
MATPAVLLLFVSLTGIGFAIGAMNVWSISVAEHHPQDMLSGIIPAAFSAGSFVGGLICGRRTWSGTTPRRLVIATVAFLTGWLPLLALPAPYAATAAVGVPGAVLTIVVACAYVTTDALTPAGRTSEAYAWLILSIGAGQSAGTALAGRLAEQPLASAALPRRRLAARPTPPPTPRPAHDALISAQSNRSADKRAGFARWLAAKDCTGCWKAARDADTESKEEWLATKRAAEQKAAVAWAKQFDMPSWKARRRPGLGRALPPPADDRRAHRARHGGVLCQEKRVEYRSRATDSPSGKSH